MIDVNVNNPSKGDLLKLMAYLGEKPHSFKRAGQVMIAVANAHNQTIIDDQEFFVYSQGVADTLRVGRLDPAIGRLAMLNPARSDELSPPKPENVNKDQLFTATDEIAGALGDCFDMATVTRLGKYSFSMDVYEGIPPFVITVTHPNAAQETDAEEHFFVRFDMNHEDLTFDKDGSIRKLTRKEAWRNIRNALQEGAYDEWGLQGTFTFLGDGMHVPFDDDPSSESVNNPSTELEKLDRLHAQGKIPPVPASSPVPEAGAAKPPTNTHRDKIQAIYDDKASGALTKQFAGAILYLMGYDPERPTVPAMKYVIVNDDHNAYWNTTMGWTAFDDATIYDKDWLHPDDMPVGGNWTQVHPDELHH